MVGVRGVPRLPASTFGEQPPGGLGALVLQARPQPDLTPPVPVQTGARVHTPVGVRGDVHDAHVDAEEFLRVDRVGLGNLDTGVQEPPAVAVHQVALPHGQFGHRLELLRRAGVRDVLEAPVDGPDGHGAGVGLPRQHPRVVGLRGVPPEPDRVGVHPAVPPRPGLAVVPGAQVRPQGGVRVTDFLDDVLRGLSTQPIVGLDRPVGVLAQVIVAIAAGLAGRHRHLGRRRVAGSQGRLQRRRLLGRRQELDLHDQLHQPIVSLFLCRHAGPQPRTFGVVDSLNGLSARYLRQEHETHLHRCCRGARVDPVILRWILRRRTPGHGQAVHRQPETSRRVTAFLPALKLKGGVPALLSLKTSEPGRPQD